MKTIREVESFFKKEVLYDRFFIEDLKKLLNTEISLGSNDLNSVNLADHDLMCEYEGFDVDLYALIDRYGQYYITEIAVNDQ